MQSKEDISQSPKKNHISCTYVPMYKLISLKKKKERKKRKEKQRKKEEERKERKKKMLKSFFIPLWSFPLAHAFFLIDKNTILKKNHPNFNVVYHAMPLLLNQVTIHYPHQML